MARLGEAKVLGGIGSILQIIPFVAIVGYILVLVSVRYVSDEVQDGSIFADMIYAVVAGIIGAVAGASLLFLGILGAVFTAGASALAGIFGFLAIAWIALIISAVFVKRAFDKMAGRLNVATFRTAGLLYLLGAILVIVLVGFAILFVAYVIQIIAFFSIPDAIQPTPGTVDAPFAPVQATKYCANCGTQMASTVTFCPKCGVRQPI